MSRRRKGEQHEPASGRWPGSAHRRSREEQGNTILELTLTLPILLTVMMAIWQFGIVYNQLISLTQATTQGAQVLQTDRMSTTGDPCADVFNAIKNFGPTLNSAKITVTIGINGTSLTKNSCAGQALAMGDQVSVQSTYPYSLNIVGMTVTSGTMSTGTITETEY